MAKHSIIRTDFHNPRSTPIEFTIGTSPNDHPEEVVVLPGEDYKGFKNYESFYKRHGLVPGKSPEAERVRSEAAAVASEAAELKAEAAELKAESIRLKSEAGAMKAEAELAVAEANAATAQAALIQEEDVMRPVSSQELPVVQEKPIAKTVSAKRRTGPKPGQRK